MGWYICASCCAEVDGLCVRLCLCVHVCGCHWGGMCVRQSVYVWGTCRGGWCGCRQDWIFGCTNMSVTVFLGAGDVIYRGASVNRYVVTV